MCKKCKSQILAATKQPSSVDGGGVAIGDLVLGDIRARIKMGRSKHGRYLTSFNGRNALIDAYQEALDLVMYLRQAIEELSHGS